MKMRTLSEIIPFNASPLAKKFSCLKESRSKKEKKKKKSTSLIRESFHVRGARILSLAIRRIEINVPRQGSGASSRREVVLTSGQERCGRFYDQTFEGRERERERVV